MNFSVRYSLFLCSTRHFYNRQLFVCFYKEGIKKQNPLNEVEFHGSTDLSRPGTIKHLNVLSNSSWRARGGRPPIMGIFHTNP